MEPIKLIVGLGNPGSEYAKTRHNAGFWFADALCAAYGGRFSNNRKLRGEIAELTVADTALRVLKPQTYMNLSGESVAAALRYFKLPAQSMLVGYDEIDFEPGKAEVRRRARRAQRHSQHHCTCREQLLALAFRRWTPRRSDEGQRARVEARRGRRKAHHGDDRARPGVHPDATA